MLQMQSTASEAQKAAIGAQQVQSQIGVQIDQDALASASLIYGAIKHLSDEVKLLDKDNGGNIPAKALCIRLATKLSYNTLLPWYKGAALMIGEQEHVLDAFTDVNKTTTWAKNWYPDTGPSEKLKALRRTYGNGWQGALAAGTFVQRTQLAHQRDANWRGLPGLTGPDQVAGVGPPR